MSKRSHVMEAICLLLLLAPYLTQAAPDAERDSDDDDAKREAIEKEKSREFAGLNFGAGISLTIDIGGEDRVSDASIVDGVVRIDDEDDKIARVMLESHYFFLPQHKIPWLNVPKDRWGIGPFLALQPGTDEIIESIGVGLMIGFRKPESDDSWNIGIGYVVDPNVKTLGDGFTENQPPPGNEDTVRYKNRSQQGFLVVFSFAF